MIPDIDTEIIHAYTRGQALEDGELVDVTPQAGNGPDGMLGGFTVPVAVTRPVWSTVEALPKLKTVLPFDPSTAIVPGLPELGRPLFQLPLEFKLPP